MRVPPRHNARVPQIIGDQRKVGWLRFSGGMEDCRRTLMNRQNPLESDDFFQFRDARAEKRLTVFFEKAYSSRRIKKSGFESRVWVRDT